MYTTHWPDDVAFNQEAAFWGFLRDEPWEGKEEMCVTCDLQNTDRPSNVSVYAFYFGDKLP